MADEDMVEETDFTGQLKHPFSMICLGASGSGKSTVVKNMLNRLEQSIDMSKVESLPEVYYIYSIPQEKFNEIEGNFFMAGPHQNCSQKF